MKPEVIRGWSRASKRSPSLWKWVCPLNTCGFGTGAVHQLAAGMTREMPSVITGVFIPVWLTRAYTLRDKVNVWLGIRRSRYFLSDEFLRTD